MTYFKRFSLEEFLEEGIFFNYDQHLNLLEDFECIENYWITFDIFFVVIFVSWNIFTCFLLNTF